MGRGSSKAGSGTSEKQAAKSFSQMTVAEKRVALTAFEKSLDERFKNQEYNGYKIYNQNGTWSAYNFNVPDSSLSKWRDTSYAAVLYEKTLKSIKEKLK